MSTEQTNVPTVQGTVVEQKAAIVDNSARIAELGVLIAQRSKIAEMISATDEGEGSAYSKTMVAPLQAELSKLRFADSSAAINAAALKHAEEYQKSLLGKGMLEGDTRISVLFTLTATSFTAKVSEGKASTTPLGNTTQKSEGGKKAKTLVTFNGIEYPTAVEAAKAFFAVNPNHPKAASVGKTGISWVRECEAIEKVQKGTFTFRTIEAATAE